MSAFAFKDPVDTQILFERIRREKERREQAAPEAIKKFYDDPLGFVMSEWPWNEPGGPLAGKTGPDALQRQFLIDLGIHIKARKFDGRAPVEPIRMCISSGNGAGKSTMFAWLCWFILRTRPMSIGTVTAGTYQQLEERTWSEIMYWGRMARGSNDFDIQISGVYHKNPRYAQKWKATPKTAKAEKAQSFAGQHAATSTSFFICDEGSEIPDKNWEAMYPCLTDGEPMIFAAGQMLQSAGEFYNICFGEKSARWDSRIFNGWDSAFTNKTELKEWEKEWGEDSDYVRVHILGLPPRASTLQFISQTLVDGARKRDHKPLDDEPLVVGYDAANGGLAKHALWFRRGLDGKSIPPILMPGDTPRDNVVAKIAEVLSDKTLRVSALFGDQAFGAVILERLRSLGYTNVFEVNFGSPSPDKHQLNMRAHMWDKMKQWLELGAIPDNEKLCQGFICPGFAHRNGKLVLESKEDMAKRRVKGLDEADSLALTFARRVAPPPVPRPPAAPQNRARTTHGWMGA